MRLTLSTKIQWGRAREQEQCTGARVRVDTGRRGMMAELRLGSIDKPWTKGLRIWGLGVG